MRGCCESTSSVYRAQLAERDAKVKELAAEAERLRESLRGLALTIIALEKEVEGEG